jgi:hypothetical protein
MTFSYITELHCLKAERPLHLDPELLLGRMVDKRLASGAFRSFDRKRCFEGFFNI